MRHADPCGEGMRAHTGLFDPPSAVRVTGAPWAPLYLTATHPRTHVMEVKRLHRAV